MKKPTSHNTEPQPNQINDNANKNINTASKSKVQANQQKASDGKNGGDSEAELTIKGRIDSYFDHLSRASADVETFRRGIDSCIDRFLKGEKITSGISMDELSHRFRSSEMPEDPQPFIEYLNNLEEHVIPHTVNVGSPKYVGHMTSQLPYFFQYISQLMAVLNQNVVKTETSKVFTLIERQSIGLMHRLVYNLPESFYNRHIQERESNLGIITSCGTLANITSLWIARNKALQPSDRFDGLQSEGFTNALKHYGYKDAVIIGSAKMHYSMDKLGSLIGLGAENIIKVGLNQLGSIDIQALKETILNCRREKRLIVAIVGIAGATETGQIDDLPYMAKVAKEYDIHFHVDAAWGGPILFSEKKRHLLDGIQSADTVTICGHKQLYLPQGISMVLCRDPKIIYHIKAIARYQARAESYDLGKHSPEGSRPAMSLHLHAGLHLLGKKGYAYLVEEGISKAEYFADLVNNHPAFELLEDPQTNIVVYRYIPEYLRHKIKNSTFCKEDQYVINGINEVLQDRQFLMGNSFISRTTLVHSKYRGDVPIVVLRAVIANPLTTKEDLIQVLEDQVVLGDVVLKQRHMGFAEVLKLLFQQTSSINRQ